MSMLLLYVLQTSFISVSFSQKKNLDGVWFPPIDSFFLCSGILILVFFL